MTGKNSANNRSELDRWVAYQRERAYFEARGLEDLRQATEAWRERGEPGRQTPEEQRAALAQIGELFPDNVKYTGTLPELAEIVTRGRRRGRPFIYDLGAWPKVRARAVAKIRRRERENYPSRKRIAVVLGLSERTVYNYDRAQRAAAVASMGGTA